MITSQHFFRRSGLVAILLLLVFIVWESLSGGVEQLRFSRTPGQKVETGIQLLSGLLCLAMVTAFFVRRRWALPVGFLWACTLAVAAGLSSFVWGPPAPTIGLLFTTGVLVAGLLILAALGALRPVQ